MNKGKSDEITRVLTKAGGGCETLGGGGPDHDFVTPVYRHHTLNR